MRRIIFFLLIVVLASCKKENQPPTCEITFPEDNASFSIGDTLTVSVEANDPDGLIHEIQLYFDGIGIASLIKFPYSYTIGTEELSPGGYVIEAIALDAEGLSKSDEISISINAVLPTVSTSEVKAITDTTALSGGEITNDGGADITSKGVCWNVNPNPTISSNHTEDGTGLGEFMSRITNLEPNTTYYIRAYATNAEGTAYGEEITFKTLPPVEYVIDYDGNIYRTIQIGEQIWMAENLKTTKYNDGSDILNITDASTWSRFPSGAYCYYENDNLSNEQYGLLYNWHSLNTGKLAPEGWHIPSADEWSALIDFLGGSDIAGGKMKSINGWNSPNEGATNESGFSALPGGERDGTNGGFGGLGSSGYWWSSTAEDDIRGIGLKLIYNTAGITGPGGGNNKSRGMSIRCIKD